LHCAPRIIMRPVSTNLMVLLGAVMLAPVPTISAH